MIFMLSLSQSSLRAPGEADGSRFHWKRRNGFIVPIITRPRGLLVGRDEGHGGNDVDNQLINGVN